MKKRITCCSECSEYNPILTQVSSTVEVILFCINCYNLKYSNEIVDKIN